ncbi:MAG: hypothetical protein Q9227_001828 [Pyrenula ochraceoflavens]
MVDRNVYNLEPLLPEPNVHQPRPKKLPRSFRSRLLWLTFGVVAFILTFGGSPGVLHALSTTRHLRPSSYTNKWQSQIIQIPFNAPQTAASSEHQQRFHVLVTTPEINPATCRTVLTTAILGYEAPTIISFQDKGNKDIERTSSLKKFFKEQASFSDNALTLLLDEETWVQLPPEVVVERFFNLEKDTNTTLRRKYGTKVSMNSTKARYSQRLLFGADKQCSSDDSSDLACSAVPYSNLPSDSWSLGTDSDLANHHNRPRWLNSGTLLGRGRDLKSFAEYASDRFSESRALSKDVSPLASVFGEQEYMREIVRQNTTSGWLDWLASKVSTSASSPNITNLHLDIVNGREYEHGIGLDYSSQLVQTMEHAREDVEWLAWNDSFVVERVKADHGMPYQIEFPQSLRRLSKPFTGLKLKDETFRMEASWQDLSLAMNPYSQSISPILQVDTSLDDIQQLWKRMWFYPYLGSLLQGIRRTAETAHVPATSTHEHFIWMGGKEMGAWTAEGRWVPWKELCGKYEKDLL